MVEIADVTRRFGAVTAVDSATLTLEPGAFLTVLGPSGCGKTTLLRMIAGFDRPDAGRIHINGRAMASVPPYRRSIGMVFQRLALFPHMTAAENIAYPLKMRRCPPGEIAGRVARTLDLVQLSGLGARRPSQLSGGQQQRVAIARALVFEPDLLLLDEPLSALDRKLREELQLEFRRIQQSLGVTTINVTHDQREALVMSDRIVVMDAGRIQQDAAPEEIYHSPKNKFVAEFLGLTATFAAEVTGGAEGETTLRAGHATLRARAAASPPMGTRVDCTLRAERIRLSATAADNALDGIVRRRIFEGDRIVYEVEVPDLHGMTLPVIDRASAAGPGPRESDAVALSFSARDLSIFPAPHPQDQTSRE